MRTSFILLFFDGRAGSSLLPRSLSSCSERGLPSNCGVWAPHCGCFSCGAQTLEQQLWLLPGTHARLLHGMWYLHGPGMEPVSPALAGRFFPTVSSRILREPGIGYTKSIPLAVGAQ